MEAVNHLFYRSCAQGIISEDTIVQIIESVIRIKDGQQQQQLGFGGYNASPFL